MYIGETAKTFAKLIISCADGIVVPVSHLWIVSGETKTSAPNRDSVQRRDDRRNKMFLAYGGNGSFSKSNRNDSGVERADDSATIDFTLGLVSPRSYCAMTSDDKPDIFANSFLDMLRLSLFSLILFPTIIILFPFTLRTNMYPLAVYLFDFPSVFSRVTGNGVKAVEYTCLSAVVVTGEQVLIVIMYDAHCSPPS